MNKINMQVKLALYWVALMFLYIYNDILSIYQPGHVAELVGGSLEGVVFNQSLLISAAVLMALPSLIVILTVTLKSKAAKIINISFGIFHILVLITTQFVGDSKTWIYWRVNELFQATILILIIISAWKWRLKN